MASIVRADPLPAGNSRADERANARAYRAAQQGRTDGKSGIVAIGRLTQRHESGTEYAPQHHARDSDRE